MPIGPAVRGLLGPRCELIAADTYRRLFVDLDSLAARIAEMGPFATMIEVGCGEGALMTRLVARLGPRVRALGIDIAGEPGRSFVGDRSRVGFRQATVADVAGEPDRFDLVVVPDVLHHVPRRERVPLLDSCRELLAPGGTIVVKEWVKRGNLAHAAAYGSDRYISGDTTVDFYTAAELRQAMRDAIGTETPMTESTVRPHRNNVVLIGQPTM